MRRRGIGGRQGLAGVESAEAARSTYIAIYRRRWGAEVALQGARLRLARAYLAGPAAQSADHASRADADVGFDPSDGAAFAAEAAPVLWGPPMGQRGW